MGNSLLSSDKNKKKQTNEQTNKKQKKKNTQAWSIDDSAQYAGTICKWTATALQPLPGIFGISLNEKSEEKLLLVERNQVMH